MNHEEYETLRVQAEQTGPAAPFAQRALEKMFADQPVLTAYEVRFWTYYHELATERSFGMAAGPIPRSKIRDFARDHGFSDLQSAILKRVIVAMDQAEMGERARQAAVARDK